MLFLVVLGEDSGWGCTGATEEEVATGNAETGNRKQKNAGETIGENIVTVITDGRWWLNTLAQIIPDYNCFPTFSILIAYYEIPRWRKLSI